MSGNSYSANCPRCKGIETVSAYSDYKPFETVSGICYRCGLTYSTEVSVLTESELKERIKEEEVSDETGEFSKLSEEQKENIKIFDKEVL